MEGRNLHEKLGLRADNLPAGLDSKYELLEEVGRGGVAIVYKARQRLTQRLVAIKVLQSQTDTNLKRLKQEATLAMSLVHPNLIQVYDLDLCDDVLYLVMEYVDGKTLASVIEEGPLEPVRLKQITLDICAGLSAVHAAGYVHRDIKPSNVILTTKDGVETAKLADFGIAKSAADLPQGLTQTGDIIGTPLYLSPEQCTGQPASTRSDLYSLGCLMYEALSGKPPLVGSNFLETVHLRATQRPIGLREAGFTAVDANLDNAILSCLEPNPTQRMQTVEQLAESLRTGKAKPPRKHTPARPIVVLISLLAIGTLGLGSIANLTWHTIGLTPEQQRQIWAAEDAAGQKEFDQGNLPSAKQHFLKALDAAKHTREDEKDSLVLLALDELCDVATVMRDMPGRQRYLVDEQKVQFKLLRQKLEKLVPILQPLKDASKRTTPLTTAQKQSVDEQIQHANDFTIECIGDSLFDLQQLVSPIILRACEKTGNDSQAARTDVNVGGLVGRRGFAKESNLLLQEGLRLRQSTLPPFDPELGRAYSFLGRNQLLFHDPDAMTNLNQAYKIYCHGFGSASPDASSVAAAIARYYRQQNNQSKMRQYAAIAVSNLKDVQPPSRNYDGLLTDLAESYLCLDNVPDACATWQRCIENQETLVHGRYYFLKSSLLSLASSLKSQGKTREAEALENRAAAIAWRESTDRKTFLPFLLEQDLLKKPSDTPPKSN